MMPEHVEHPAYKRTFEHYTQSLENLGFEVSCETPTASFLEGLREQVSHQGLPEGYSILRGNGSYALFDGLIYITRIDSPGRQWSKATDVLVVMAIGWEEAKKMEAEFHEARGNPVRKMVLNQLDRLIRVHEDQIKEVFNKVSEVRNKASWLLDFSRIQNAALSEEMSYLLQRLHTIVSLEEVNDKNLAEIFFSEVTRMIEELRDSVQWLHNSTSAGHNLLKESQAQGKAKVLEEMGRIAREMKDLWKEHHGEETPKEFEMIPYLFSRWY